MAPRNSDPVKRRTERARQLARRAEGADDEERESIADLKNEITGMHRKVDLIAARPPQQSQPVIVNVGAVEADKDSTPPVVKEIAKQTWKHRGSAFRVLLYILGALGVGSIGAAVEKATGALAKILGD